MRNHLVGASRAATLLGTLLAVGLTALPALAGLDPTAAEEAGDPGHLVISELQTGGGGASDEFVELYNPTPSSLPLEGLELVYVTASGGTVTRKAAWAAGAPALEAGRHVLVTNEAGIYAAVGDLTYAGGVAATGGAWALRIQGASTAVDAVGWGTAAAWLEGRPAAAPPASASLERLPGGAAGSGQDTDDNLLDFAQREVPDPQNLAAGAVPDPDVTPAPSSSGTPVTSPTPMLTATPTPTPAASGTPAASVTPTATPTPSAEPISVAAARALPDGATALVRGVSLTDAAFGDGGGYLADASGGIAVLVEGGTFARGQELLVSGEVDDRYAQRTLRVEIADIAVLGPAEDPAAIVMGTGGIDEQVEGRLVEVRGSVAGAPTALSGGLALDIDDGTGAVRVFVADATGISIDAWATGADVTLRGVVGQRDSSGSGTAGYRVQPRDAADIRAVLPPGSPSPSPSSSPTASATPSPSGTPAPSATPSPSPDAPPLVTITAARSAASGTTLRIRGVVTVPSGLVDPGSAVVQDAEAGILVRLGDEAGSLARGELVELTGSRSTKAGMLTLRVAQPATRLGTQAEPSPTRLATGAAGEAHEARLVIVRGAVAGRVSRTSAGGVSFEIDDGSGPLRIAFPGRASLGSAPETGSWIEVRGVLGQETTGAQPQRGYRVWARVAADVTVIAATAASSSGAPPDDGVDGVGSAAADPAGAGTGRAGAAQRTVPRLAATRADGSAVADAPALGGRAGHLDKTSPRPRAAAMASPDRAPTTTIGLGLLGLAGALASGAAAWRTGSIGRLRSTGARRPDGEGAAPLAGLAVLPELETRR